MQPCARGVPSRLWHPPGLGGLVCVGGIFQVLDIAMRPDRFPAVNTMKRGGYEGRLMSSSNQEPPHKGGEGVREVEYRNKQTGPWGWGGTKKMGEA